MAKDTTGDTSANEYMDVVDQVWDDRSKVAQARDALREARQANEKRFNDEGEAIQDARNKLNEKYAAAEHELNKRARANREAYDKANKVAGDAFREATGGEYEERSYY